MSLIFSTALRNMQNSMTPALDTTVQKSATTIAAVDGGSGVDSFTDSGSGFLAAGFKAGDSFLVMGFSGSGVANNGKVFKALTVVAGTITISTGLIAAETAGAAVVLVRVAGGSLKDIFKNGVLKIYSGSQPATADAAATGTLLATVTVGSGAFTAGQPANGLSFGDSSGGVVSKDSDIWSSVIGVTGIAGWFRFYANGADDGTLDNAAVKPRIDGAIGTGGSQLNLSSTSLTAAATLTIDSFALTFPAQ